MSMEQQLAQSASNKPIMIKNVRRTISVLVILMTIQQISFGQFEKYSSFEQLDSLWVGYMNSNKLDSATLVFEYAQELFPDRDKEITFILGFMYSLTKRDSLAIDMWSYGQQKGYYFALSRYHNNEAFKDNEIFISLAERDKQIGDSINNLSHVEYEVRLPKNYSKDYVYPILFVFHGGGATMETAKANWTSKVMQENFITVYIQSYIIGFRNAFDWISNDEKTNKEISVIYQRVIGEYSVNKDKIFFLGFSAGGKIALDYAFNDFVPLSGLILSCPDVPKFSDDLITKFVNRDNKLVILTGEYDWAINKQKELVSRINNAKGSCEINVQMGIGHTYSADFSSLLDEYLIWICD